ncbi:lipoate--protein ligase family protein [Natranaerobius trueperi]|uniref:Octanoyltransferase n=1 Tax=Natranaerobius trueperi TaxID=759412 RepID=A0A226C0X8_9FIRM|nr:biotin/lipoate A/B protein ligase family protein [Natranaerobius trueperi]OWZ84037.1 octanoyltransferase [Natranaerobius trueperi]
METWRLIIDEKPSNGATNMARDEAILKSVSKEEVPPTIRFYFWDPPCVSMGYFQKAERQIDFEVSKKLGFDYVRRPTGGRAILHKDELTYSVIVNEQNPKIPDEVIKAYKVLSRGLMYGLDEMGIRAEMNELKNGSGKKQGSAACFDAPSWYELLVEDKKVIGSAQVRKYGALLQHGSIPIKINIEELISVLNFPSEKVRERTKKTLKNRAAGLADVAKTKNIDITQDNLIKVFKKGFESALDIKLEQGTLTEGEKLFVSELEKTKYLKDKWNLKR